jgi:hypothetical protein
VSETANTAPQCSARLLHYCYVERDIFVGCSVRSSKVHISGTHATTINSLLFIELTIVTQLNTIHLYVPGSMWPTPPWLRLYTTFTCKAHEIDDMRHTACQHMQHMATLLTHAALITALPQLHKYVAECALCSLLSSNVIVRCSLLHTWSSHACSAAAAATQLALVTVLNAKYNAISS